VLTKVIAGSHYFQDLDKSSQLASTNEGWVLIFTKFNSRLKCVKESFNSVDVLNRFKLIKLQDCKVIVFCSNITVNYNKDIKLLDSQSKICFLKSEEMDY